MSSIIIESIFAILLAVRNLFNALVFWVDNPILKMIFVSLLTLNIQRFFDVKKTKQSYIAIKIMFTLYSAGSIYALYLQRYILRFEFWMLIAIIPLAIFTIFGVFKLFKKLAFLQKYVCYESIHIIYSLIAILWQLIDSSVNVFDFYSIIGSLVFSILLIFISSVRYGKIAAS